MTTVKNLPGVSANALALDALGNLWVGTLDGLVQINTANALIKRRVNNLPGVAVQTLAASPWGTLWIGTPTGLAEAEIGIERVVQTIAAPTPARSATARKQKPQGQSAKTAQATAKPAKPRQRVVFLTTQPDQFKLRSLSQVGKRSITSLHFDQVGSLWVGSTTGLLRVNPFNGATGGEIPYLPSSRILSLSPDTGGKLWVGTSEGLAWVDTATFRGHPHRTFLPTGR
jgi:ligand-binding sensor domain-containing protein